MIFIVSFQILEYEDKEFAFDLMFKLIILREVLKKGVIIK
jgi:hypothetical protein